MLNFYCLSFDTVEMTPSTNTTKALGDFFYRYCQCILFGIFMVCLCIIVQIKFKIVPFLAYSVYADAINGAT